MNRAQREGGRLGRVLPRQVNTPQTVKERKAIFFAQYEPLPGAR